MQCSRSKNQNTYFFSLIPSYFINSTLNPSFPGVLPWISIYYFLLFPKPLFSFYSLFIHTLVFFSFSPFLKVLQPCVFVLIFFSNSPVLIFNTSNYTFILVFLFINFLERTLLVFLFILSFSIFFILLLIQLLLQVFIYLLRIFPIFF